MTDTDGIQPTFNADTEMDALKQDIAKYYDALNQEGVWLFISALGCWGVPNPFFQVVAFVFTLFIFAIRMSPYRKGKGSFLEDVKAIEENIRKFLPKGDVMDAKLYKLGQLEKEILPLKILWTIRISIICWVFYFLSGIYFIYTHHI